jgi:mono/diheme cytochrome c family protein
MRKLSCLVLLTAALAGCGGDDDANAPAGGPAAAMSPKQLFVTTCGSCHQLSDAGTNGSVGPDLDDEKPDKAKVLKQIEEGGGVMPAGLLKGSDAEKVAEYVSSVAG